MPVLLRRSNKAHWKVPQDLVIDPRATALADRVAAVMIELHRAAISGGYRANDLAPQPPLDPTGGEGRDAAKGKRSPHRGNRTGKKTGFAWSLRRRMQRGKRGRGRDNDTSAQVVIEAPGAPPTWLAEERDKRGIEYLFTDGKVAEAIAAETMSWLDEVTRPGKK